MRHVLTALAGAALITLGVPATAQIAGSGAPEGALMVGTVILDRGGAEHQPEFGPGTTAYVRSGDNPELHVVQNGDAYDVTPMALMGRRGEAPRAVAGTARQPGGG